MLILKGTRNMAKPDNASQEVVMQDVKFSHDDLASITSFDDALQLLAAPLGTENISSADATLGDGFAVIDNKDRLIDVPFLLINWQESLGDHGPFTIARGVTRDGFKFVMTDGSTGIHEQLQAYTGKTGKSAGLLCRHGLRRSDYTYDDNGTDKDASTYYIDTAA
jgi:hypothetical protein